MTDISKPIGVFDAASRGTLRKPQSVTESRRVREHTTGKMDGRTLRAKGRTVAVNYKVTPKFKERLYRLAEHEGEAMVDVLEKALEEYIRRQAPAELKQELLGDE